MTNFRLSRVIAFRPEFVALTGSVSSALYLSQVVYHTQNEGEKRLTAETAAAETCLSIDQVKAAHRTCVDLGLVSVTVAPGLDRAKRVSADLDAIEGALRQLFPIGGKSTYAPGLAAQAETARKPAQDSIGGKSTNASVENPPVYCIERVNTNTRKNINTCKPSNFDSSALSGSNPTRYQGKNPGSPRNASKPQTGVSRFTTTTQK